jgi:hypothetical protein
VAQISASFCRPCGRLFLDSDGPRTGSKQRVKTILVVDDNRDAADLIAMLVYVKGHRALVAHHSKTGQEIAHKVMSDIIIPPRRTARLRRLDNDQEVASRWCASREA